MRIGDAIRAYIILPARGRRGRGRGEKVLVDQLETDSEDDLEDHVEEHVEEESFLGRHPFCEEQEKGRGCVRFMQKV